jgi:hypothetical protein
MVSTLTNFISVPLGAIVFLQQISPQSDLFIVGIWHFFNVGVSVLKGSERKKNSFLPLFFSTPTFSIFPTLHLSFLTSAENGNRKMAKSFPFRVLFYVYGCRVSKMSNWRA